MPITIFTHDQSLAREGRIFDVRIFYPVASPLADQAVCDILVVTGSTGYHVDVQIKAIGTFEVYGYYGTQYTLATGVELTKFNRNPRAAALREYTPEVQHIHNPTITNVGTEMYSDLLPAGASQGNQSQGANVTAGVGYYLEPGQVYLLRVKNVSGAAAPVHHLLTGHEAL